MTVEIPPDGTVLGRVRMPGCDGHIELRTSRYLDNGRLAVYAVCADGEPYTTLSVNLVHADIGPAEFAVKDHDENGPFAERVLALGLFEDTGRREPSGYCTYPIWRLKPTG